ncbi:alpha/beta fold hydrolase [Sphaerisporangium sp. TRM90804]|uniref:thioesterase II family protein n=1 Tax=Sphaerisporangium sp. TRM90804 TaxID=3031113 RepID=UPI00244BDF82|nr:alpha/beta fold hydrolase [Sphaerisporangium sp. TRM90804]MDH2428357.1 alpha/beta fold hydrolase [Sphaerisporangium sp. TRM90804]
MTGGYSRTDDFAVTGSRQAGLWLRPGDVDPDAVARLFLFHHSGGSAAAYREWPGLLPSDVAVQCVQLPGRQDRRHEAPYDRLEPLAEVLAAVIGSELDGRPYALFGHSMGALLAYRVALALERGGWRGPVLVAASGWAPAGFTMPARQMLARMSDPEVAEMMRRLGALPPEILRDAESLAQAVRTMRADSAACASHRDDGAAVGCPVVAYAGRHDPLVAPEAMGSWASRTPHYLGTRTFPGNHFFIRGQEPAVTADLVALLRRYAAPRQPHGRT